MFSADRVLEVLDLVPDAVVDGGWGIDALVGRVTRAHDDLDLVVPLSRCDAIVDALRSLGFELSLDERPTRVVVAAGDERVDLHLVSPTEFGMTQALPGGLQFTYVLDDAAGTILGRPVRCLSAAMQVLTHCGYEPDGDDRADMAVLAEVSGESLPPPYAELDDIVIRRPALTDVAAICVVRLRSWRAGYAGIMPQPVIDAIDLGVSWANWYSAVRVPQSPRHHLHVAGAVGSVHGFAVVSPCRDDDADRERDGEINLLYADPTAWNRGVGAALLTTAVDDLHSMGFTGLRLWTLRENAQARTFYERFGWRYDGATKTVEQPSGSWVEVRYRVVG